jgi:hypothetical protein
VEPGLLIILIPVLILVLLYFLPELQRWLSRRNRQQAESLKLSLADIGETLRTLAARLRPYRDLQAEPFRRHYEPARDRLQKVVDTYQRLSRRLAVISPSAEPYGLWAFLYIAQHPQEIWQAPTCAVRLWQLQRDIARLRGDLDGAENLIARAEETPGGLVQSVRQLREQRLSSLQETLQEEESAGLASAKALQGRLAQLQRQTDMLLETMQDGPPTGLGRMDALATELNQLEEASAALEADAGTLRRRRRAVDARLQEVTAARQVAGEVAGDEPVREGVQPLLDRAAVLEGEARSLQKAERFGEAEERAGEGLELLQLAAELSTAANHVRALQEVADVSLQTEAIEVLGRRLRTTFRAAYALCEPGGEAAMLPFIAADGDGEGEDEGIAQAKAGDRRAAFEGLKLRVRQLAAEAQQLQEAHEQDVRRVAQEADQQTAALEEAWQALQQTVTLPPSDPAIAHYRALQEQRERASGDPLRLRAYKEDARSMADELTTAADTIRHGFRQLETLRVELPAMLSKAESEAQNWRCLQPLLLEMKESIATLWQIGGSDVHLAEMQATLSEIETLEEQVRASYAALDGERRRLAVLERRITQTLQTHTLRRSQEATAAAAPPARDGLRSQVESRLSTARDAQSIESAHNTLLETLDWLQDQL